MPFYLALIFSNFSHWNFKFFSISDLSYGTNQDFMPFIQAQFFVAQYSQKLHSDYRNILSNATIVFMLFEGLLKISLWGNKCDLSISAGTSNSFHHDPLGISLNHMLFNKSEKYSLWQNIEFLWLKVAQIIKSVARTSLNFFSLF